VLGEPLILSEGAVLGSHNLAEANKDPGEPISVSARDLSGDLGKALINLGVHPPPPIGRVEQNIASSQWRPKVGEWWWMADGACPEAQASRRAL
jgi:hypothetical protein